MILSIWTWRSIGHLVKLNFYPRHPSSFYVIQALVGAAAVKWSQSDFVMALHFGISLISFAAVLLLTFLIFEVDKKFEAEKLVLDRRMKRHIVGITIYIILLYILVHLSAM